MSKFGYSLFSALLASLLIPIASSAQNAPAAGPSAATAPSAPAGRDWLTWGYDGERTSWNRGETTLSIKNVSKLVLKWNTQVGTVPNDVVMSTLTSPVVVEGAQTPQGPKNLLFTQGADGTLFAIDAESGQIAWQKAFPNTVKAARAANVNCPNTAQATPAIDKARGLIFFTTGDGKLHALALGTGDERMTPTNMVAAYSRSWSLNIIDNVVYVASGRGCGNGVSGPRSVEWGAVSAMDVTDLTHPQLSRTYTGKERPAGPWGRGGAVKGPNGVYVQTADGPNDPGSGIYGNAVMAVMPKAYGVADSFIASNWKYLNGKDLDFGSASPVVFPFGKRTLLASGAKEAVIYVLDANNLGGTGNGRDLIPLHDKPLYQSPRLGNDLQSYAAHGLWGAMSTYMNSAGDRWLYVPMWGAPAKDGPKFKTSYGDAPHGSVMAFHIVANGEGVAMDPQWISHDLFMPDAVAVANGVLYAVQTAEQAIQHPDLGPNHDKIEGAHRLAQDELSKFRSTPVSQYTLYALDAETGKELYSSKKLIGNTFTHFTQPVVALGKVFLVSHDARVYAFGLK
jgi:outer membrane protein assembly factor BamB